MTEMQNLHSKATIRNCLLEDYIVQLQKALEEAEAKASQAAQQRAESDAHVTDLTVRLEALQDAGNEAAASVNVAGNNIIERVNNIPARVHEVALHGVRHGAAMTLGISQAYTGSGLSDLEITPEISHAMEVNFDGVDGEAEEIADVVPSVFIVDKVFE